jgi:hypothetical protein
MQELAAQAAVPMEFHTASAPLVGHIGKEI